MIARSRHMRRLWTLLSAVALCPDSTDSPWLCQSTANMKNKYALPIWSRIVCSTSYLGQHIGIVVMHKKVVHDIRSIVQRCVLPERFDQMLLWHVDFDQVECRRVVGNWAPLQTRHEVCQLLFGRWVEIRRTNNMTAWFMVQANVQQVTEDFRLIDEHVMVAVHRERGLHVFGLV